MTDIYITYGMSILLFIIGILGLTINSRNILRIIISLEIILLSITILLICSAIHTDDTSPIILSLFILAIAGSEAAIGLSILVLYHKYRGSILITRPSHSPSFPSHSTM
jgi:NADH-ubiquinone oxidoreductase chain 4L